MTRQSLDDEFSALLVSEPLYYSLDVQITKRVYSFERR